MSESDGTDLAGVIGTWVAVALAAMALAGIWPILLHYRRSKTQKAQALALLNDPSHKYVRKPSLFPGIRQRKVLVVPNLGFPPKLQDGSGTLNYEPKWKEKLKHESTSGWVSLGYVINAAFPDCSTITGDSNLLIEDGQSLLPVHRAWILVLAVMHCYAFRRDHGLPEGTPSKDHVALLPWRQALAGQSGAFFKESEDDGVASTRLTFVMHPTTAPAVLEGRMDMQTRLLGFFGFVKMTDGTHLIFRHTDDERTTRWFPDAVMVAKFVKGQQNTISATLFEDLELGKRIKKGGTLTVIPTTESASNVPNLTEDYLDLGTFQAFHFDLNTWISRDDAYRLTAGYLSTTIFSSYGFLYDRTRDPIISKLFSWKFVTRLLDCAKKWTDKLDQRVNKIEQLKDALEKASTPSLERTSWSRGITRNLYELDSTIIKVFANSPSDTFGTLDWKYKSISVLSVCERGFTKELIGLLESPAIDERRCLQYDKPNELVAKEWWQAPSTKKQIVSRFDYTSLFRVPSSEGELEHIPIAQAAFAALQGQIRAVMWKMSLSPEGVHAYLDYETYYIGTRPTRSSIQTRDSRSRTRDFGTTSSSSSSEDSSSSIHRHTHPRQEIDFAEGLDVPEAGGNAAERERIVREWSSESDESGFRHQAPHAFRHARRESWMEFGLRQERRIPYILGLHMAAQRGDEAEVRRWIEKGGNKNARTALGATALMLAAANGDLPIVQYLITIEADLELRDEEGFTALMVAAGIGQLNVVQFLLERGADAKVRGYEDTTALQWAASRGEKAVVEVLFKHGAEQDSQDKHGNTALHSAIMYGHGEDLAELLLQGGVDPNLRNKHGQTALHFAAGAGEKSVVQALLTKGCDTSLKDTGGRTPLEVAVWQKQEAIVQLLQLDASQSG